jgi:hypothetical protein
VTEISNTLIARNSARNDEGDDVPQDCRARVSALAGGASFDSDGTCRTAVTVPSTVFRTVPNPGLGPLADNGGPTMTMALSALSPAVDAGSSCVDPLDQRGAVRDPACDVGAFERSAAVRLTSATGAGTVEFRATDPLGGFLTFLDFEAVDEADMPNQAGKPAGVTFPYGFFSWTVGPLVLAGGTADVEMVFPAPVPTPAQYWKVIDGVWTDVCLHIPCVVDGHRLTLTFEDGGLADLDRVANAVIVDPGGLGSGRAPDTTPPAFSGVPGAITVEADTPDGAIVAYLAPTAADDQDGPVAVECSPASGSLFPVATTLVTCSASDLAGNHAAVTFTVTVENPRTDGAMVGAGRVRNGDVTTTFAFAVQAGPAERGGLWIESRRARVRRLVSIQVTSVVFSGDGRTVAVSGSAWVDGRRGYTFEMAATDNGVTGTRDTFSVTVKDPAGAGVLAAGGFLTAGDVDSTR